MGYRDAAEDHGGMLRLKDIEHFGKNVARMVEGLSDSLTDDPGNKHPWQTRKESYTERLRDPSTAGRLWNRHAFHPCRKLTN
jgi:hypothetical protein